MSTLEHYLARIGHLTDAQLATEHTERLRGLYAAEEHAGKRREELADLDARDALNAWVSAERCTLALCERELHRRGMSPDALMRRSARRRP